MGPAARYTIEDGCLVERLDQDTPAWNPEYDTTVKISSIQTYNADCEYPCAIVNRTTMLTTRVA